MEDFFIEKDNSFPNSCFGVELLLDLSNFMGEIIFDSDNFLELSKRPVLILGLMFLNLSLSFSLKIVLFKKIIKALAETSTLVLMFVNLIISSS